MATDHCPQGHDAVFYTGGSVTLLAYTPPDPNPNIYTYFYRCRTCGAVWNERRTAQGALVSNLVPSRRVTLREAADLAAAAVRKIEQAIEMECRDDPDTLHYDQE